MAESPAEIKDRAHQWLAKQAKKGSLVLAKKDVDKKVLNLLKKEGALVDLTKDNCLLKLKDKSIEDYFKENYWRIISQYLDSRYGDDWYITGKAAYLSLSKNFKVPNPEEQLSIATKNASNTVITLAKLYSIVASKDRSFDQSKTSEDQILDEHVNFQKSELTIINSSSSQYKEYQEEIVAYLKSPNLDTKYIINYFNENSSPILLARLIGALEQIGNYSLRNQLEDIFRLYDSKIKIENPFEETSYLSMPEMPEYLSRFEISMEKAKAELKKIEKPPKAEMQINDISNIAAQDAYHNLTIEGYNVTEELINEILENSQLGKKEKSSNVLDDDSDLRNRLAAKGFMSVMEFIQNLIKRPFTFNENLSKELWRLLWKPSINANLIDSEKDVYRNHFVSIRGAQHVPPNYEKVSRLIESFYKHANDFTDGFEQSVFLHYFYVWIHPHSDGNGRVSRFLMNLALIKGGYNWLTIDSHERKEYFSALEKTSVKDDISYFAKFILKAYYEDHG